ncbi:BZ3500_MvSof-1268-A1-R1_Chr6-3g08665 [Microbotryum saponariae]|uniref:BZ3500_MvSof-1268-A1-R1_Chr6-3g08665 protein n=1 Tax=Microbotryum saponariae TaxID=289078 RepID=A0A2X0NM98_9BASI|nr:BZ3500_MvSof-1268-A1-R1_Chr6-3g08665 [Microbotryum saponariae]SDA07266.1 BZ3501_MvSof-1269-A2-R1_Chr6-2g08368 [Microbotryum saponariae]
MCFGTAVGRNRDGTQGLRTQIGSRTCHPACLHFALSRTFVSKLARRRTGMSSCSADDMTRSYDLGLIVIGIGIDRHPSLRFLHGHPRYLDVSSIFNLRLTPPFRMCSDGYERNKTVLKKGNSRLVQVGASNPRSQLTGALGCLTLASGTPNTVRCSHSFCGRGF